MNFKKQLNYLCCYTRTPEDEDIYSSKLAYSMHLAVSEDGKNYYSLNHNSGILFAGATQNSDGSLTAKSLKNPCIFEMNSGYGVVAIRTEADGLPDLESKGSVIFFTTSDFISYKQVGLVRLSHSEFIEDAICSFDMLNKIYVVCWKDEKGRYYKTRFKRLIPDGFAVSKEHSDSFEIKKIETEIEGAQMRNELKLPPALLERLWDKFTVPENVRNEVPKQVKAGSEVILKRITAVAHYSDGTKADKRVDWDVTGICWEKKGTYKVKGRIHQDNYPFPMAENRADPCIGFWGGKYYFIATNDADDNNSIYIREANDIQGLFKAEEVKILDTKMYSHLVNFLWAPEFHIIDNELYIFHAGTSTDFYNIQCHVMKLKHGGSPMNYRDWECPIRVVKKDGSPLYEEGITLDMTCFKAEDKYYAIWAQRQFNPIDLGSWLYIAQVNSKEPWKLESDPVLISMPEYGWANNRVFVDEGPYPFVKDNKIYITIASAMIDSTYVVGLLSADITDNLLASSAWKKENFPILTSRSVEGEFGPGHISFITDDIGNVWNAYHARPGIGKPRCSGLRRVHFDIDGVPRLDLTEERDLNPGLSEVETELVVE